MGGERYIVCVNVVLDCCVIFGWGTNCVGRWRVNGMLEVQTLLFTAPDLERFVDG